MIPYAILGTSWISEEFYAAAKGTPLELRGVCSRSKEKGQAFAQKIGQPQLPVYVGLEALAAAPDIRAAYIASPNHLHSTQSEALLLAGKHVLCEKPIAVQAAALQRLQSLAASRALVYMEAIMYLHTPARRAVKEALPALGEITSVHFDFSQLSSRYPALARGELPNIFNPAMAAGAFNDLGVYCVYPALDLFGAPQSAKAQAQMLHTGADGTGAALLQYPAFPAVLAWSKLGQSHGVSQILGTCGTITIRSISQFQGITLHDAAGRERSLAQPMKKHEVMRYEAQAFCDYIQGRPAAVPPDEASALAYNVAQWMELLRRERTETAM